MGLSGKAPDPPPVASVGDLTSQAVNANIANLPAIMEAYKKYGPEAASSMLAAAQTLNPTLKPLGDLLNQRIGEVSAGGIPDTIRRAYETNFRNSMADRGFVDSPASANAEAIGLAGIGEDYAQNTITGANAYGRNLPTTPGLGELGLNLPTVGQQEGIGQEQNLSAIQAALDAQARQKSKNSSTGALIGAGVGILGSVATGGLDIPVAAMYSGLGGAAGGTFF